MANKDLSLFVFGEDTEYCVLSCAAAGASAAAADSIDNGSSDDNVAIDMEPSL